MSIIWNVRFLSVEWRYELMLKSKEYRDYKNGELISEAQLERIKALEKEYQLHRKEKIKSLMQANFPIFLKYQSLLKNLVQYSIFSEKEMKELVLNFWNMNKLNQDLQAHNIAEESLLKHSVAIDTMLAFLEESKSLSTAVKEEIKIAFTTITEEYLEIVRAYLKTKENRQLFWLSSSQGKYSKHADKNLPKNKAEVIQLNENNKLPKVKEM